MYLGCELAPLPERVKIQLVITATGERQRAYRQRRRRSLAQTTEALRARYDRATAGCRRQFERSSLDPLYAATGVPLVLEDRAKAMRVYGLLDAKRPSVTLRKVHAESWGDDLHSLVMMGSHYQARGRSALHAAGEAVALGGGARRVARSARRRIVRSRSGTGAQGAPS